MNNIFITGGTSYLGKKLIEKLDKYNLFILKNIQNINKAKNIVEVDKTPENFNSFFNENNIEFIIHLASNSNRQNEASNLDNIVKTNIDLGVRIQLGAISSSVKKIISAGSYNQDVILNPQNAYSLSKESYEKFQKFFSSQFKIWNTSIHFGDIYGPNDHRDKLIPYIKNNEDNAVIEFNSDGNGYFSPVYIEDATNSIIKELQIFNNDFYQIKTVASELITVKEFLDLYKTIRKKNFSYKFLGNIKQSYSSVENFSPSEKLEYNLNLGLKSI